MSPVRRMTLCGLFLTVGFAAQAGLEKATETERPPLRAPLTTVPMELGDWVGRDVSVDPRVLKESQADEYINRIYENRKDPGRRLWLWINYSRHGAQPAPFSEDLPAVGGMDRDRVGMPDGPHPLRRGPVDPDHATRLRPGGTGPEHRILVLHLRGGGLEHYVRNLPITSRSSHGRTTRGSGMTVEVFCPGETDPDGAALEDFARPLIEALEPIMPARSGRVLHSLRTTSPPPEDPSVAAADRRTHLGQDHS